MDDQHSEEPIGQPPDADASGEETSRGSDEALDSVRAERDALQDRLLRTAAEFDNYRKRVERERREMVEFASADALLDMLPIIDNLERALHAPIGPEPEVFRKGVELIYKQMLDLLRKRGARPIDAVGADFDPNVHEAVVHEVSERHREGEVMQELQRGYTLGERLLRPSMVKVAKSS